MSRRRQPDSGAAPEPYRYRIPPAPPVPGQAQAPAARPAADRRRRQWERRGWRGAHGTVSVAAAGVWLLLLILPALALRRLCGTVDWWIVAGAVFCISVFTWRLYRGDKAKAQSDEWRTPESTLHLAELAGGWPAAFLAQRRFRHKITKKRYQFFFWCIVTVHEFAALDYLLGWRLLHGLIQRL